jgi:2',3'-cyclic-nucleotide 2'-phosphodiesterase/3'-nucleotidase
VPEETRRALLTPFGDDSTTVDRAYTEWVDSVNVNLAPIMARVVGHVSSDLTRSRQGESAVGDWVADAMRDTARVDIAFQNAGGLRADVAAGDLTVGDVFEVIPFDNTVVTVTLTGAQVLETLEQGVSPTNCVQLSGLKLVYDPQKPRGQRVVSATLPGGKPIDPAARYKVATNDFMAQGGDGFTTFAKGPDLVDTGILVRESIQAYVARLTALGKPLVRAAPGRIVNLASPQPARGDAHSTN